MPREDAEWHLPGEGVRTSLTLALTLHPSPFTLTLQGAISKIVDLREVAELLAAALDESALDDDDDVAALDQSPDVATASPAAAPAAALVAAAPAAAAPPTNDTFAPTRRRPPLSAPRFLKSMAQAVFANVSQLV